MWTEVLEKCNWMTDKKSKLLCKAYNTGRLTNDEFVFLIKEMTLKDNEYLLDSGDNEMANAEFILRLTGKEKKMHKLFWK